MKKFICVILLAVAAVFSLCSCRSGKDVSSEFVEGIDGARYYYKDGLERWYGMSALTESSYCVGVMLHKADSIGWNDEASSMCGYVATIKYNIEYGDDYIGKVSIKVDIRTIEDSVCNIPVVLEHCLSYERGFDPFMTKHMLCYAQDKEGEWSVEGFTRLSNRYLQKIKNG